MLSKEYMTRDRAYLIGRNFTDRHWPENDRYGNVLCEITVRPGETPTLRDVVKAAMFAMLMAIRIIRTTPKYLRKCYIARKNDEAVSGPYTGDWVCQCGYEGVWENDSGVCPICHGYGICPWNG